MIFKKKQKLIENNKKQNLINDFYFNGSLFHDRIDLLSIEKAIKMFSEKYTNIEIVIITDNKKFTNKEGFFHYEEIKPNTLSHAIIVFESDEKAYDFLMNNKKLKYISAQVYYPTSRYFHKNDLAKKNLQFQSKLQKEKFEVADYENIIQVIENVKDLEGDYVEIGVYKGGSAYTALKHMKDSNIKKNVFLLDTFEGFNYVEAANSVDAMWETLPLDVHMGELKEFLSEFENHTIIKSNIINEPLPVEIKKIAACNIDVDMYDAIENALYKVADLIVIGGIIILEDVGHTPSLIGAHCALQNFIKTPKGKNYHNILLSSGQSLLIKYKS